MMQDIIKESIGAMSPKLHTSVLFFSETLPNENWQV